MSDMIYRNEEMRRALAQLGETVNAAAVLLESDGRMAALESIGGHDADACLRVLEQCAGVWNSSPKICALG